MSLVAQAFAVPSRIQGLVRLLAYENRNSPTRQQVLDFLSPPALFEDAEKAGEQGMAKIVLNEAVRLGVVREAEDGTIGLTGEAASSIGSAEDVGTLLPPVILDRVVNGSDEANEDLALVLAWYLEQDVLKAPGEADECQAIINQQGMAGLIQLNDVRFGNLLYWGPYLGLAQVISRPLPNNDRRLMPDPTECLRRLLPPILGVSGGSMPVQDALTAIGRLCPIFEGGRFRQAVRAQMGRVEVGEVSSTTAHALLRLQEDGLLQLRDKSDAETTQLRIGPLSRRVAEVVLL